MSSRTNTPIWRTAHALAIMFWSGVACAPLAALVLVIADSGGAIKFALVLGMASVVLIGLSVTWRRDATSVERELVDAVADVESNAHRMIAELRAEVRQIDRGHEPAQVHGSREDEYRRLPRPHAANEYVAPQRDYPAEYVAPQRDYPAVERGPQYSPPRRATSVRYEDLPSTDPMTRQEREDEYVPPRRGYPVQDEDPDMVRHTEMVSVTRHETTTMRAQEGEASYRSAEPEPEAGVYRGRGGKAPLTEKIGKLRRGKDKSDSYDFDARSEADSLLSGLQGGGNDDDWRGDFAAEPMVPRQRRGYHDEPPSGGYQLDDFEDRRRGPSRGASSPRESAPSGAWRSEERSAELRMGMRESRGGPENGWEDGPSSNGRAASWSMQPEPRGGGRHYSQDAPAISSYEAEPTPRWSDYDAPQRKGAGSYMDSYYGRRR